MASLFLKSSETNAHPIDIATASDLARHLREIDVAADDIEKVTDSFLHCAIKLERVDTRGANIMKDYMEALGGGIAMSREAREFTARDTDVIISGSRRTLLLLAARLKGEPYGLDAVGAEIAACTASGTRVMTWANRTLDFTHKTYVMGILNCTPDSFYPFSRSATLKDAMKNARSMLLEAGVDIIDVGGESTDPVPEPVAEEEEIRRVIPVIQALRGESDVMISIDTRKKEVAARALDAGADIVNDISALRHNDELARLVAHRKVPVVLMHMRGVPKTMQKNPSFRNTISEILRDLQPPIAAAIGAALPEMIIVDPGIGFGKRIQENLRIIRELSSLKTLSFPILVGLSRKSFIGEILDRPVEERLIGTITANTLAILNGANIIRVHDVPDAVEMVKIIDSVRRIGS